MLSTLVGLFCVVATVPATASAPCNAPLKVRADGIITVLGQPFGEWVDDLDPNECQDAAAVEARGLLAIYGIPQGEPGLTCPEGLGALEWYPYFGGLDFGGPPPCGHWAYVVQDRFSWDSVFLTRRQRRTLLRQAERCHPALILRY